MSAQKKHPALTQLERRIAADFLSHVLNSIAGVHKAGKRQRGSPPVISQKEFTALKQRLWSVYARTRLPRFFFVWEDFSNAQMSWESNEAPSQKRWKSEYVGRGLVIGVALYKALWEGSAYVPLSDELGKRGASMQPDAIKTRVSVFRKNFMKRNQPTLIARRLFEEWKHNRYRQRHPNGLPTLREIEGADLTIANRQEIELLRKIDQEIAT